MSVIKQVLSIIVVGGLLSMSGCLSTQENQAPAPAAVVAFFNGSPNAPDLDVYLNGSKLNTNAFTYKFYSGYLAVAPGSKTIQLKSFGGTDILVDTTILVDVSKAYTIFTVNKSKLPSSKVIQQFMTTDTGNLGTASNGMVRFVHLSPDTGPVYVTLKNGSGVVTELASGTTYMRAASFTEMEPVSYTAEIRRASDDFLFSSFSFNVTQGGFQSILLVGFSAPPAGNTNSLTYKVIP